MLNKTKSFLFKELFHVIEKWVLSYDFGMRRGCGKIWCKQLLHKSERWKNILWGHGQDMPCSVFILLNGELWTARHNQGVISHNRRICEMSANLGLLLSLSKSHQLRAAAGTPARQQDAGRWGLGFQHPLQGRTPSDAAMAANFGIVCTYPFF